MAFPDGFVDEVRHTADIVRYVSDHVSIKKMGTSWKGLCPFHHEKTPSFNVNPERGIFHCFGCGAGGDVFKSRCPRQGLVRSHRSVARRFGDGAERRSRRGLQEGREGRKRSWPRCRALQNLGRPRTRARSTCWAGVPQETLERSAPATRRFWADLIDSLRKRSRCP